MSHQTPEKVKSDVRNDDLSERKARLKPMEFRVTQERQTEKPFSNKYNKHWESGSYNCIVCDTELFRSETKFQSSSGWPAFSKVVDVKRVKLTPDVSHVGANLLLLVAKPELARTEVSCARCNAHLGHLFQDGPKGKTAKMSTNTNLKRNEQQNQMDNNSETVTSTSAMANDPNNRNIKDDGSGGGCTSNSLIRSSGTGCAYPNTTTSCSDAKICFFQTTNPVLNYQPHATSRGQHMVSSNSSGNLGTRPFRWNNNGNGNSNKLNDCSSLVKRRISLFSSSGPTERIETVSTAPRILILRETSL